PSPDAPLAPLPRIEDLPLSDQGYDREAVRLAFDSFYRHAAQLDASLRALEAVEVFRRDADALRNDLRALRSLGLGAGQAEPAWGEGEPAPYVEVPHPQAQGWGPAELAPSEDTEPEALTVIAGADEHGIDPWEQQHDDAELEDAEPDGESVPQQPEPELAEPELAERGGMFRRRRR